MIAQKNSGYSSGKGSFTNSFLPDEQNGVGKSVLENKPLYDFY
jgi:hypothetical protein